MRTAKGLCVAGLLVMAAGAAMAAAPPAKGPRQFTKEQIAWLNTTLDEITEHSHAGRFEEAEKLARARLELRERVLGRDHWQTHDAMHLVERWQRLTKVPAKQRQAVGRSYALSALSVERSGRGQYGEALKSCREALAIREKVLGKQHPDTAESYNNAAHCLWSQDKSDEALPLFREALAIREKVLGEHPDTADSYNNVGCCLDSLGKWSEALPLFRKAIEIQEKVRKEHPSTATSYGHVGSRLLSLGKASEALPFARKALEIDEKVHGKEHTDTAASYNNVATCLHALGKWSEALPLFRKALEIQEKVGGKEDRYTAAGYNNVAYCLRSLGRASEALPLYRKGLEIREKVLGKEHPSTAESYNNVACCLLSLGKPSEALPFHRKALEIHEKIRGKNHPDTAMSYNNLAYCLHSLGKESEALPLHSKALEIQEKVLGKEHPSTVTTRYNVAYCLHSLGKSDEALPLFREALAIREKVQGKAHPDTATSYNSVGYCLSSLGKESEALPHYRKALQIQEKILGREHLQTAIASQNVALCLWNLEEHAQAVHLWQRSLAGQEAARFHLQRDSGFDRAATTATVLPRGGNLAVGLAKLGQPRNAFAHAEAFLARGLLDDMATPNASADVIRLHALEARLQNLDAALVAIAGLSEPSDEQRTQYAATVREQRAVLSELAELIAEDSIRRVLPLSRIQKAIPADAALVLWIDAVECWACVVRGEGAPRWTHLPGSDKKGKYTEDESSLPSRLHSALHDPTVKDADRRDLSAAFTKLIFDPLRPHLKGVKRLFVVPTGPLARVPLDALIEEYTISYVPSGSVLALLAEKRRSFDGSSLLALGDPVFDRATPPTPPASGLLIKAVLPNSLAAKSDLRAGDVLLEYDGAELDSIDDLKAAIKKNPVLVVRWREGSKEKIKLGGGPLGVIIDNRSSRAAYRAWRKEQDALAGPTTGHARLPGTRFEVEAIAKMVKSSKTLLGSDASEQKLDELQSKGELKKYRLIHLATHGDVNERIPGRSALILAQDRLPDPLEQARQGRKVYDGRLTVSAIRADKDKGGWELDADLVVLSACETGLGKDAQGDGLLGFTQALIHKGARSVLLSRWKVDDVATALLMTRFYENLLGKRDDLKKPLSRAASLTEAARWLRELPRKDVEKLAAHLFGGSLRDTRRSLDAPLPSKSKDRPAELPRGEKPFAHPYYWSAFVLVGDPD